MSVSTPESTPCAADDGDSASMRIDLLLHDLHDGGIQVTLLKLAHALDAAGHQVRFLLCHAEGVHLGRVPPSATVVALARRPVWRAQLAALRADPGGWRSLLRPVLMPRTAPTVLRFLGSLADLLHNDPPTALISASTHLNLVAVWARSLARSEVRLIVTEHDTLSASLTERGRQRKWRWRYVPELIGRTYPRADAIVGVSHGVADDLAAVAGVPRHRVRAIANPVITPDMLVTKGTPPEHPWFEAGHPPVLVAMGRLHDAQKDFSTLIHAFALVYKRIPARLLILGEGPDRQSLESLVRARGLAECVALPGFVDNPLDFLSLAACFVLSSTHEGLPTVLIEALACGCPIVSTDCPSGPAEILDGGRFGTLVPVGDAEQLATAIIHTLESPPDSAMLVARGRMYSADTAAAAYAALIRDPAGRANGRATA